MADKDIALMAHMMRRVGFGETREELEARVANGYEATVEELLHPEEAPEVDEHILARYQSYAMLPGGSDGGDKVHWMYHLLNTKRPLQEKMVLLWHQVFATADAKVDNGDMMRGTHKKCIND